MNKLKRYINLIVFISILISNLVGPVPNASPVKALGISRADALVLVNSTSVHYLDFQHYIQPYLDHFGVPYTVLDIASTAVGTDIGNYALIIIGHSQLDANQTYLDTTEQSSITSAVGGGTGLVNFDNFLSADHTTGLYSFINAIFGFGYSNEISGDDLIFDTASEHYITQRHITGETINTGTMSLAGVTLPTSAAELVSSGSQPILAVTTYINGATSGRAVQWGSYDWMSHSVKGPLMGLDDLVWRSLVWAARKPFVLEGMPPFVTMRMDDTIGPLDWIHIANEVGFKPWAGIFINQMSETEASDLKGLVDSGNATTSIHAFDTNEFFYFNHYASPAANFSDAQITANLAEGTKWHTDHQIPISKYLVPHYYEVGSNALDGLNQWGVEFIGTMMDPGQLESGAPWMNTGPFRKYENGDAYDRSHNIYYADTLPTDSRFFNCITEFRDADLSTNYEWDPTPNNIPNSIAYGTKWLTAGLDGMDLATLFSHEYMLTDVDNTSMRTIMQGIGQNIAAYNPIYVTMDDACRYARAIKNSNISASEYNSDNNHLTVHFTGQTDVATKFYVFAAQGTDIQQSLVDVPVLNGSSQVEFTLPGALHHITITPNPANVIAGVSQQFNATGYDSSNNPIPNLNFTWSAAASAGTITSGGLFTAAVTPGAYPDAISASFGGYTGYASVQVTQAVLDHFSFDPITSPQYIDVPFSVKIRALDATNNPVVTYSGVTQLSDTTGSITPSTTGAFINGVWTGSVTIRQAGTALSITAQDSAVSGQSALLDINIMRQCPCSVWESGGTPETPNDTDNRPIEVGFKFHSDVSGYILGVKFYKGTNNTGSHTGHLWTAEGTLLAEAEFNGESASGWQQVLFNTPVAINANTTYVASYFSPGGIYSTSEYTFVSRVNNTPLHALADGEDGPNGINRFDTSGFPTLSWADHAPNYWVDVIFDTEPAREYSIWNGSETPANPSAYDQGHSIEVGMKFRSDSDGQILGLRYYKGSGVTGTHTGHLWSASGSMLGTVIFSDETAQGWQEARFTTPIQINAKTTYIVSYYSPDSYFAITLNYLTTPVSNPPLKALANEEDGPNGVYNYDSSAFPAAPGNGANYWLDVVFTMSAAPDTTPPTVITVSPPANASGVAVENNITALFDEPLNAATINSGTFQLKDAANNVIPIQVSYNAAARMAVIDPESALTYTTNYQLTIKGGTGGVTDTAGNALANNFVWSFTTSAPPPPPPDQGPGGPILVIGSAANPFGRYYAEILRSEGLNEFSVADIATITASTLSGYDLVILGEMSLTSAQVTLFNNWILAGGNLIAMRPDKQLANLLGLTDAASTLSNQYLRIDTNQTSGRGITGETIQFHSSADLYTAKAGTSILATLYANATTATSNPAVTLVSVGSAGGQAAAFTYDLARSVVYTRQGNPAWAEMERDSNVDTQNLIRSDDKFYGDAPGDSQPDWIDFNKIQIPQADEQQRLLANMILNMTADRKPLPRFWYFPRGEKAVIVMTGDDHGSSGTISQWETFKSLSPTGCSVDDWACIRGTSYLSTSTMMTAVQAEAYSVEGFETAMHFDTNCQNFTPTSLETIISSQLDYFITRFPYLPPSVTQRTHCIAFSDWDSQPIVSLAHGVRLDANYYYWPPAWANDRPGLFTGSGMIMRFARLDGSIIDSYQAVTQMTDESGMTYPRTAEVLMDNALGPLGYYGAFTTNMHTDIPNHVDGFSIINAAKTRGVPVISAKQMLNWLDGRNGSAFQNLVWSGTNLTFHISVGSGANGLQAMLPAVSGTKNILSIMRDGNPVTYTTDTIKGITYAVFNAVDGNYSITYYEDTTGPVINSVSVTPDEYNGARIDWQTNESSSSRVDYGISAAALNQNTATSALVLSHSQNLVSLNPDTTYYYRVTSVDEAGNQTVYPAIGQAPLQFTTLPVVLTDTTLSNFAAGTPGTCSIVETNNGEVILPALVDSEFGGTSLPGDWSITNVWNSGGAAAVSGGNMSLNGVMAAANTTYPVGLSMEFVATISGQNTTQNEHIGLATDLNGAPWAIFSTGAPGGTILKARTMGTSQQETDLGSGYLGSPHRFRIDWLADRVDYYIDGAPVTSHAVTFAEGTQMRPIASDFNVDSAHLVIDWMRLSPYSSPCVFTSRVFNAGEPVIWNTMSWTGTVPPGSSLSFSYRIGNSPDLTGAAWVAVSGSSPANITGSSPYIQYQAVLSSSDSTKTPVLEDLTFYYTAGEDTTAPVITNLTAVPSGSSSAVITWNTNEPSDLLINYGTLPGILDFQATSAALVTSHSIRLTGLNADTTYYYRVTSKDAANNSTSSPVISESPASFTTGIEMLTFVDTTAADFGAGSGICAVDDAIGNGAIRLPATVDEAFAETTLPNGWSGYIWPDGAAWTVNNGSLTVDGASARNDTLFDPGKTLEFTATFRAANFQHVGFGGGDVTYNQAPIAMFSTRNTTTTLFTSIFTSDGSFVDVAIPNSEVLLGNPHRYRIDWKTDGFDFYIDGALVDTRDTVITEQMRMAVSDIANGGLNLSIDSMRLSPYLSPCSVTSQVFDAGEFVNWRNLAWAGSLLAGTNVTIETRSGNVQTPGAGWSAWVPVGAADSITSPAGRYLQYRITLTSEGAYTPVIEQVTISYNLIPNRAPAAAAQSVTTNEDIAVAVTLTGSDPDGDTLQYFDVTQPAHGLLSGTAPNLTYTPSADYYSSGAGASDSFTFRVSDGVLNSAPAAISITVNAVNDIPVANAQSLTTDEDTAKAIVLSGSDIEGSPLTFVIVNQPAHGALIGTLPNITYSPAANYYGADTFTFRVNDGGLFSEPATVSITITAINDAPVANGQSVTTNEDTAKAITLTGSDAEGSSLTYTAVTSPAHGTLSGTLPNVTYMPEANYNGADSFTFTVNDGVRASTPAAVAITVNPVNDKPTISGQETLSTLEDTALTISLSDLTVVDPDNQYPTGFSLAVHTGANYTFVGSTITPALNFNGVLSIPVTVIDGAADSDIYNLTVTVTPVNDAPVITGQQTLSTNEDTPLAITLQNLLVTDPDNTYPTGFSLSVQSGSNYTVNGSTITPTHNFHGNLSVQVRVNDGAANSTVFNLVVSVVDLLSTNPDAGGPYTGTAGQTVALTGSATCPAVDTCSYAWDLDGDGQYDDAAGSSQSNTWNMAGNYTIGMQVNDDDGNTVIDTATVQISPATHSIALQAGWNLISFNVQPLDSAPASVLNSIAGKYDLLYAWDASGAHPESGNWLKYDNIPYTPDTLTALNQKIGFWIHLTAAATLEVSGNIPANTEIALLDNAGGWNLVGFPAVQDGTIPSNFARVYAFHAIDLATAWKLYDRNAPVYANDLVNLTPGWGYWVKPDGPATWLVSYAQP